MRFVIGGDGPYLDTLRGIARDRAITNVDFIGAVADVGAFYAKVDVVLLGAGQG